MATTTEILSTSTEFSGTGTLEIPVLGVDSEGRQSSNTESIVDQSLTQNSALTYNESMDYSFISALLLLGIFIIDIIRFLQSMTNKDKFKL